MVSEKTVCATGMPRVVHAPLVATLGHDLFRSDRRDAHDAVATPAKRTPSSILRRAVISRLFNPGRTTINRTARSLAPSGVAAVTGSFAFRSAGGNADPRAGTSRLIGVILGILSFYYFFPPLSSKKHNVAPVTFCAC